MQGEGQVLALRLTGTAGRRGLQLRLPAESIETRRALLLPD